MDKIKFNEFEGWDIDNSSALIIVGLKNQYRQDFDNKDLLIEYGLDGNDGELQNYPYASHLIGIDLISNQFGFDIHQNNVSSYKELVETLEKFGFDYFWFFDGKKLNFISDYNWNDNEVLIKNILKESDIFITTKVCTVSTEEEW